MGYWNPPKNCQQCGETMRHRRIDAKFCSANCRKRWSRRKESMRLEAAAARSHIRELLTYLQHEDLRSEVESQLRDLMALIEVDRVKA